LRSKLESQPEGLKKTIGVCFLDQSLRSKDKVVLSVTAREFQNESEKLIVTLPVTNQQPPIQQTCIMIHNKEASEIWTENPT
jgi:hypothetical protein